METVEKEEFWGRVVAAPGEFESLVTADAAWNACAAVVWRVVGVSLVLNGPPMLVAAWEENLGLEPAEGDGLNARKAAVLGRLCDMGLPVTVACLEAELGRLLGEGMARVSRSGDLLTVSLALDATDDHVAAVASLLARVLPQNLVMEIEWADGLPMTYTRLEYLEGSGTQYIDTGYYVQENDVIRFTNQYLKGYNIANFEPYMISNYSAVDRYILYTVAFDDEFKMDGWHVASNYSSGFFHPTGVTNRSKIDVEWDSSGLKENGQEVALIEKKPLEPSGEQVSLSLFSRHLKDGSFSSPCAKSRLFRLRIDNVGDSKMKLVPALDPTGAPCMYDTVTRKAFYNSGTGDFLYPGAEEEATTYSLRRPLTYAQVTAHGIRRLYHVPRGYNGTREEYAAEHGYKVLVETPEPEEGYWSPVWHETEDCIELEWVEAEPPAEEEGLIF